MLTLTLTFEKSNLGQLQQQSCSSAIWSFGINLHGRKLLQNLGHIILHGDIMTAGIHSLSLLNKIALIACF